MVVGRNATLKHGSGSGRSRRLKLAGGLAAIALLAAACGSSSSKPAAGATTSSPSSTSGTGTSIVLVKTATVGGDTVLVDSKGLTLYKFALDKPGKIACTASCTPSWPPLLVPSGATLSMSMQGLATEARPGGGTQVTFNGSPLYRFAGDTKAGQDNGVGIPHWSLATTSASSSTTTTTKASGGGYGY
jgi:predicted lipoprotein with Yx(FWY)xxD motif